MTFTSRPSKWFLLIAAFAMLSVGVLPPPAATGAGTDSLYMQPDSAVMVYNGQVLIAPAPVVYKNYTNYAPLGILASTFNYRISYDEATKEAMAENGQLSLRFLTGSQQYTLNGEIRDAGAPLYTENGALMVPLRLWAEVTGSSLTTDDSGIVLGWAPKPPVINRPHAEFATNKSVYMLGEPITYTDLSSNIGSSIVRRGWEGRQPAFFSPGTYTIELEVENSFGATDTFSRTITVSDEQLYSEDEFNRLFAPPGSKFNIGALPVMSLPIVSYELESSPMQMMRSNRPEHLFSEGLMYQDTIAGRVRLTLHHQNKSDIDLAVRVIATNPGDAPVRVTTQRFAMAGPADYVTTSGKLAVARFLETLAAPPATDSVLIEPGQSVVIMPQTGQAPLRPGLVMTAYGELESDGPVKLSFVAVKPSDNPLVRLPSLPLITGDGRHVRGTFFDADFDLHVDGWLGMKGERLVLGDNQHDRFINGYDGTTGGQEVNLGNRAVVYSMTLNLSPYTLVAVNARGGHYSGAFLVDGKAVQVTDGSMLLRQNEAAVLYRTGDSPKTVEFKFIPASGSNLPLNLLFLPTPKPKRTPQ